MLLNLLVAAAFGLLLGLLVPAVVALRRRAVRTHADVRRSAAAPTLAQVSVNGQVSALVGLDPAGVSEMERLRACLRYLAVDAGSPALVLTAAHLGHDATETATQLAVAMAQAGDSVVLVDADLRNGEVRSLLALDEGAGLTSVIVGEQSLLDAIQVHPTSGLAVLTAGATPPDPGHLLGSRRMVDTIELLRATYDTVVITTGPVSETDDAIRLAPATDGLILLVRESRIRRRTLDRLTARLHDAGAPPVGVVLSHVAAPRTAAETVRAQQWESAFPTATGAEDFVFPQVESEPVVEPAREPTREPVAASRFPTQPQASTVDRWESEQQVAALGSEDDDDLPHVVPDHPAFSSLLDEFLTAGPGDGPDVAPVDEQEPAPLAVPEEWVEDEAEESTMWRPSRWITS